MMERRIFLIGPDGELTKLRESAYDSEDLLQRLLARHPDLLVGEQIDPDDPRRWLLIAREAGIPDEEGSGDRWTLDHLFLDQDAVPTLVEVKRSSDTRIRREVVGQMLDYAANAVSHWPVDYFRAQFEARCESAGNDPEAVLAEFLGPDRDPEEFWQRAKTNLQAGRLRLLFVADEIPDELRNVVEFLNSQMDPTEVLAVEIKQYADAALRTLVPTVLGQTVAGRRRKGAPRAKRQWDEASFFEELAANHPPEAAQVAQRLLAWAKERGTAVRWGQGAQMGSFFCLLERDGVEHQLYSVWTYGKVELLFQSYQTRPPFDSEDLRLDLLRRFNAIDGVTIPDDAITRRPAIWLKHLAQGDRLQRFLDVFEWFMSQLS